MIDWTDDWWIIKFRTEACVNRCAPFLNMPWKDYLKFLNETNKKKELVIKTGKNLQHDIRCTCCGLFLDNADALKKKLGEKEFNSYIEFCKDMKQPIEMVCCFCSQFLEGLEVAEITGAKSGVMIYIGSKIYTVIEEQYKSEAVLQYAMRTPCVHIKFVRNANGETVAIPR